MVGLVMQRRLANDLGNRSGFHADVVPGSRLFLRLRNLVARGGKQELPKIVVQAIDKVVVGAGNRVN
jgi:hypothetical protein